MFEDLNEIGKSDGGKKAVGFMIALVLEGALILGIIVAPLIFFSVLPDSELLTFLIAPPPPPPPPPPPSEAPKVQQQVVVSVDAGFVAPKAIPTEIAPPIEMSIFTPVAPVTGGVTGGSLRVADTTVSLLPTGPATEVVAAPPKVVVSKVAAVRVGGDVQASRVIRRVEPVYPPMAKTTRTQGTVELEVHIDEDGVVVDVTVVSGPALLRPAAVDAVRQWRYSPTFLNGEPMPIVTTVRVNFSLDR